MSTKQVMGTNGGQRRQNRSWPEALKREIVEASFAPGCSVSVVARRYNVNANQVFRWRKTYRSDLTVSTDPSPAQLIPVTVRAEPCQETPPVVNTMGLIEIDWSGRYHIRVGRGVDARTLERVLDVLERR